jgi:hypothetical protein
MELSDIIIFCFLQLLQYNPFFFPEILYTRCFILHVIHFLLLHQSYLLLCNNNKYIASPDLLYDGIYKNHKTVGQSAHIFNDLS